MSSAEHVQNLLKAKFQWPKPRIVQKSKFANNIGEEISDENSIEKGSQQLIKQATEEDQSPSRGGGNYGGVEKNNRVFQSDGFKEAVPKVNVVLDAD